MPGISIDPTDPTTQQSGKPPRQDSDIMIMRDLQNRVAALERAHAQAEGMTFISPNGALTETLSIDNSGNFLASLGLAGTSYQGPCLGVIGTGSVIMATVSITTKTTNSAGSRCLIIAEYSGYCFSTAIGGVASYLQIDGDDWAGRGIQDRFFFNQGNVHAKCCYFARVSAARPAGTHVFSVVGSSVSGIANVQNDGNDWAQLLVVELP